MSTDTLPVRSAEEIAERLLATFICGVVAADPELRPDILKWVATEKFEAIFSPGEWAFITDPEPSDRDVVHFTWYVEVTVVLGWAAGLLDHMPPPTRQSSLGDLVDQVPILGEPVQSFLSQVRPRFAKTIHEHRQRLEDIHARAISDHSRGGIIRQQTDIEVAQEQHKTLNWLACVENAPWEQVPVDT